MQPTLRYNNRILFNFSYDSYRVVHLGITVIGYCELFYLCCLSFLKLSFLERFKGTTSILWGDDKVRKVEILETGYDIPVAAYLTS